MSNHGLLPLSLASALALMAASCGGDVAAPLSPDLPAHATAPGNLVAGAGHVQTDAGLREFTFHATARPDGAATGSYKVVLPNGLFIESDVTCLAVEGHTGWVAGVIRGTNAGPVVVGSRSAFFAVDGGEGEGATDVVSLVAFNLADGADTAFCEDRPHALPTLVVTDGNVEVR